MIIKKLEYGLLLLVALVFHIFIEDYISFWILAFLVMLPLISILFTVFSMHGVTAELIIKNSSMQKNNEFPIQLKVYNKFFFLVCRVRIKLTIRNELLQQEQTRTFFMTANHSGQIVEQIISSQYCGVLSCSITELRIYEALGLFSFCKKIESSYFIVVLPTAYPLMAINSAIVQNVHSNAPPKIIKGNDPSEIMDIRDYRDGDQHSKIHWKLSAKYNQFMVKDFGDPISYDVLIMFDLNGNNSEHLNGLLDTVYSVFDFLLKNQISYEVEWYDSIHEHLVRTSIAQKNDMELALENILSNSRFQKQPWVLKNCSNVNGYNSYSVVFYLCSEITSNSIDQIHKRLPGGKISILLVTDSPNTNTDLTLIDLRNIKESISNLMI